MQDAWKRKKLDKPHQNHNVFVLVFTCLQKVNFLSIQSHPLMQVLFPVHFSFNELICQTITLVALQGFRNGT